MFGWLDARAQLAAARAVLVEIRAERDYWREKAEILLDSTLFHRGEVRNHVFSKPPKSEQDDNPFSRVMGALSRTEIESAKRPTQACAIEQHK